MSWLTRRKRRNIRMNTIIGRDSSLHGNIKFIGGLHIYGVVQGDVTAGDDECATLSIGRGARIEGNVKAPFIIVNGMIFGDVQSQELIEFNEHAQIHGDVYYQLMEMAAGVAVNGKLVHLGDASIKDSVADIEEDGILSVSGIHKEDMILPEEKDKKVEVL